MSIRLIQCLCPRRHAIMAVMYDDATVSPDDAVAGFSSLVELAIQEGAIRRRCEMCREDTVFHYEDGITIFSNLEDARAAGAVLEAEQLRLREQLNAEYRAEKN